jgi:magnesium chelatase subunit D
MDPQEGELTPGQMDRFDLCVCFGSIENEDLRAEIVKRHLRFERAPEDMVREFGPATNELRKNLEAARERLPYVSIPDGHTDLISSLCLELGVAGQRGDLAVARAAKSLAALDGRDEVVFDDIKLAALLALEHRRREIPDRPPPPVPPQNEEQSDPEMDQKKRSCSSDQNDRQEPSPDMQPKEQDHDDPGTKRSLPPPPQDPISTIGPAFEVIRYLDGKFRRTTKKQKSGRRTRAISNDTSGHYRAFRLPGKNRQDIALDATLRAAAPFQKIRKPDGLAIAVKRGDLREKVREKKAAHTILFLVDASGSMGVRKRMVAVKGAILSLLTDAYQKRDRVGLMIFRGNDTRLLLPPTRSPDLAVRLLKTLPTGGMTPLTKGLADAYEMLTRGRSMQACENRSIVILTDGRVNVAWKEGVSPQNELVSLARTIANKGIRFVVVDTEEGYPRLGRARTLSVELEASYFRLEDLMNRGLAGTVQELIYTTG